MIIREKISLASYMIELKKVNSNKPLAFDNYNSQTSLFDDETKNDFLIDFKDFLENSDGFTDEDRQKDIEIDKENITLESRFVFGKVFYGDYGKFRKAKNVKTNQTEDMDVNIAPEEPYYFLFFMPKKLDKGIVLFERKGNRGIKSIFERFLNKELFRTQEFEKFRLTFKEVIPENVFHKYMQKGEILKINVLDIPSHKKIQRSYEKYPEDKLISTENRINSNLNDVQGKFSIDFKIDKGFREAAKKFIKGKLSKKDESSENNNGLISLEEISSDNTKVDIKLGDSERSFYLNKKSLTPYMDITNQITEHIDGHPSFDEINKISQDYAKELIEIIHGS